MRAATLTQDYSGFFRQPVVSRRETGADRPQANRPRPSVLPAERVVEGELLSSRNSSGGESLDQLLQRGRFDNSAVNASDTTLSTPATQRAISAYLDNLPSSAADSAGQSRTIDYYV
jgi:hypothetical protein